MSAAKQRVAGGISSVNQHANLGRMPGQGFTNAAELKHTGITATLTSLTAS